MSTAKLRILLRRWR